MDGVLSIQGLRVGFIKKDDSIDVLKNINLPVDKGKIVGLIGGTGSGKTLLASAITRLPLSKEQYIYGNINYLGKNLLDLSEKEMHKYRGKKISLIVSNPSAALNPLVNIGKQISSVYMAHHKSSKAKAVEKTLEMLVAVGIPDPQERLKSFPYQLSGGMAQRIVIAMSLITNPELLVADEPTFGLDVTIQTQVLDLLKKLSRETSTSILLMTRDLSIIANYCDEIYVLHDGYIVENSNTFDFFKNPKHIFSKQLLAKFMKSSTTEVGSSNSNRQLNHIEPRIDRKELTNNSIISVKNLYKYYETSRKNQVVHAVNGVSFDVQKGTSLGMVGESGSGKTTIGRILLRLVEATAGKMYFENMPLHDLSDRDFRRLIRPKMQMVFQEPFESLNPYMSVKEIISEPIKLLGGKASKNIDDELNKAIETTGLNSEFLPLRPFQLTAGQQQRVAIARVISTKPDFIVLDEPASYLGAIETDDILNLLLKIQATEKLTYLYISHDLSTVQKLCHNVAVMYLGRIVELGPTKEIFDNPMHPYTRALLSCLLKPDPEKREEIQILHGEIPSPVKLPQGCFFNTRCPNANNVCKLHDQKLVAINSNHSVACWQITGCHANDNDNSINQVERR